MLRDKVFDIAQNPKCDVYQRELASVVYKSFDKKLLAVVLKMKLFLIRNQKKNYINQLIENSRKEKYTQLLDRIQSADLADMQLIINFNKRFRVSLCVIDIYRKYTWAVPFKDKKGITFTNAFQKISDKSKRKPNKKYGLIKATNFIIDQLNHGQKKMIYKCIQRIMKENLLMLKESL